MTMAEAWRRGVAGALAAVGVLAVALAGLVGPGAAPAAAAARVVVANEYGKAEADRTYATTLTLRGSGFQSIDHGFGGIYVMFGWVDDPSGGSWRPSLGGVTGEDYRYVPDAETKDNQGFVKFVAFPGSETESAANGGLLAADGTWSTTLVVPGPRFESQDRAGNVVAVDCLQATCGVLTVGAHGQVNANNETFTPVAFADLGAGGAAVASPTAEAAPDAVAETVTPAVAGEVRVGLDQQTVVVGRVLGFTGQGFAPGEQVVGSLVGGQAAVGPLTAGAHGEVAGVLQLPADLRPGTQAFQLTGAASGAVAKVEFTAIADPAAAAAAANAQAARPVYASPLVIAAACLVLLLVGLIVWTAVAASRRRRASRRAARAAAAAGGAPAGSVAGVPPGVPSAAAPGGPVAPATPATPAARGGTGAPWPAVAGAADDDTAPLAARPR
jgi:hypothetical protein